MEIMKENLLFNSPLETGVRSVIILDAIYPKTCDLSMLVWLDHLVVHSGDVNGPTSLHPDVPQRNAELLIRRTLIEDGLKMMRRFNLIQVLPENEGITYQSTEEAFPFVNLLKASYSVKLRDRAQWIAENITVLEQDVLKKLITDKISRWNLEFEISEHPGEKNR